MYQLSTEDSAWVRGSRNVTHQRLQVPEEGGNSELWVRIPRLRSMDGQFHSEKFGHAEGGQADPGVSHLKSRKISSWLPPMLLLVEGVGEGG